MLQPPLSLVQVVEFPRRKVAAVMGSIIGTTAAMWLVAGLTYAKLVPQGVALLVVAYTLGLRHALDADHIAAIDNVTRRLVQNGQKPVSVGLFFSLGHSTIVIIATMLVAALSSTIQDSFNTYGNVSAIIGPSISAGFLFIIGTINGVSAYLIAKNLKILKNRAANEKLDWDEILENSGFFSRVFGKRLFKIIDAPWKMYFVGFLFGLGFDTASEIALLGIVALQALSGANVWLILFLPILFTCGMTLVDTADGILMLGAYGWVSVSPMKKLYYNLAITIISCIFAFFVSAIQFFSIFQSEYDLDGPFWDLISGASDNNNFQAIGIALLSSFLAGWLLSRALCWYYSITESDLSPDLSLLSPPDDPNDPNDPYKPSQHQQHQQHQLLQDNIDGCACSGRGSSRTGSSGTGKSSMESPREGDNPFPEGAPLEALEGGF